MKTCNKCKIEQPLEAFSKNKSRKDGLQSQCKACKREYYQQNLERIQEQNREWKRVNADRNRETKRAWKQSNPEKVKASEANRRARKRANLTVLNKENI